MPPSYIQAQDVQGFILKLAKKGQTASNCAVKLKILRNLFKMATRQGMISHNPAEAVDLPRGVRHTREPFSVAELQSTLPYADQNWKLMILLGAYAGMRIGDAASLSWNNIDLEKKTITYLPKKKAHQPGARNVSVPIHPDLLQAILEFPINSKTPAAPIMPALAQLSSAGRSGLSSQFGRLLIKAGIDTHPEKIQGQRTFQAKTFHSLRHTFVSMMAESGVSQELRKELAGHDSDIHRIYTHYSDATYRKAIDAIPSVTGCR
jgi:integrase